MSEINFRKYLLQNGDDYMQRYIDKLGKEFFANYMTRVYERMENIHTGGKLNLLAVLPDGSPLIPPERHELFVKLVCQFISDFRAINYDRPYKFGEYYFANDEFTLIKRL